MKYRIESTTTGFKVRSIKTTKTGKEVTRIIGRSTTYEGVDAIIEQHERSMA